MWYSVVATLWLHGAENAVEFAWSAASFWPTVVGAVLAATFGVFTSLWLDYRRNRQEVKQAAGVIARELRRIVRGVRHVARSSTIGVRPGEDSRRVVTTQIVMSNSFATHYPILISLLSRKGLAGAVEDAYIEFSRLDRLMDYVMTVDLEAFKAVGTQRHELLELKNTGLAFYWTTIRAEEIEHIVLKDIEAAITVLEGVAGIRYTPLPYKPA
jgi:predicted outer membrane lipoprotein